MTREVISLDSDSDERPSATMAATKANAKAPRYNSKQAVQPGSYANAPKQASAYHPQPHYQPPPNQNGYAPAHTANVINERGAKPPRQKQVAQMPTPTQDMNEVFENQSVSSIADRDNSDSEDEDDEKTLFEESFPEIGDDALLNNEDPEICTLEEARHYRQLLRTVGPRQFVADTVESEKITAKKLITAFGCGVPRWMEGALDVDFYKFLQWALIRELNKRSKKKEYNTVDDAVKLLKKSRNIIVLTGAGISTSLGIPDFRSKDIGLYAKLEHLGLADAQEVFDIELFREDPSIFYSVAKDIMPDHQRFTPTHAFIKLLQDKDKLLTNYSQNIDNIEGVAGVRPEKLIQCHGSFATATCTKCSHRVPGDQIFSDIRDGIIPRCKKCIQTLKISDPSAMKRKRSKNRTDAKKKSRKSRDFEDSSEEDEGQYDLPLAGVMKPDITFFGEALPDTFHDRLVKHDKDRVDLIVVIGTSLKVAPVSEVVDFLDKVPAIYISREPVKHLNFDIDLIGDCDVVMSELCRRAGWGLRHEMIPEGQQIKVEGDPNFPSRWTFKQTYPLPAPPKGLEEKEFGKGKMQASDDEEMMAVDETPPRPREMKRLPKRVKKSSSPESGKENVNREKEAKARTSDDLKTYMKDGKIVKKSPSPLLDAKAPSNDSLKTQMVNGKIVKKSFKRSPSPPLPSLSEAKEEKINTWMENGKVVTGVWSPNKEVEKEDKISTWMENGRMVSGVWAGQSSKGTLAEETKERKSSPSFMVEDSD